MNSFRMIDSGGETCIICDICKVDGIHLYTSFICSDCEKEIVSTETDDKKYKYFLVQLRKVTKTIINAK